MFVTGRILDAGVLDWIRRRMVSGLQPTWLFRSKDKMKLSYMVPGFELMLEGHDRADITTHMALDLIVADVKPIGRYPLLSPSSIGIDNKSRAFTRPRDDRTNLVRWNVAPKHSCSQPVALLLSENLEPFVAAMNRTMEAKLCDKVC